jgi:hypothetical protein
MAEAVAVVALVVAAYAMWQVVRLNRRLEALSDNPAPSPASAEATEALRAEIAALRRDLDQTNAELAELKAAANVLPAPPVPPRRRGDLDQLREELRASHREAATEADDEPTGD